MNILTDGLLLVIFFIFPVIFAIQPLFNPPIKTSDSAGLDDLPSLERRKKILYREIKELEMEFAIGNLNEEDYQRNRLELKQEVSQIIARLKKAATKRP